ncbi:Ubiquinone biosynthesis O-methyltransferase [Phycisphaerales bacterium]|nr:Ubiquinone biosynthesis O-methyltransferase [Phycisphaerales bacterium]
MNTPTTFDVLESSYNWRLPTDRVALYADVAVGLLRGRKRPRKVLDIGCGTGIAQSRAAPMRIREEAEELWGLEPDEKIPQPAHVTHYQHALMETADLPDDYFDLAYSCLVMEHVAQPEEFLRAVYRKLAPGGEYLFMTMNAKHYFVRIASTMKKLRIDEAVLKVVRRSEVIEDYHYPVQYRCNHAKVISRMCRACGFEEPRFAFVEFGGPAPYFPGPLKPFLHLMNWKRTKFRRPDLLLELYCLVRKPGGER